MQDNTEQWDYWNGRTGHTWMAYQRALDRALGPLGEAAMHAANIVPGARVLDVGCGCGDTVLALADRVGPQGWVTGVDISEPMLARASERLGARPPGGAVVELQHADAASAPLPDDLDLVFSRFGVMFFADPKDAFAHLREALRPGGDLAFVCWRGQRENPWTQLALDAVAPHLPAEPASPPDAPGPFAFADRDRLRAILAPSFSDVVIEPHDQRIAWTRSASIEEAVDLFSNIGRASRLLREAPAAMADKARVALADAFRPHVTPDGLILPSATWIVTARA